MAPGLRLWKRRHQVAIAGAATLVAVGAMFITARGPAEAHGSMQTPPSRLYACYLEGPETPDTAACQAAIAVGGTQPLYDWNEVNIADAAGRHREIIPDGRLCSAGRDKYGAFDVAREDWPTTRLPTGGTFRFLYKATAPHRGQFELYLTRDGYDPRQPLRWSDLEATPFHVQPDPPLVDGAYAMDAVLPAGKSGRHLIYSIWQRSDSPEAFYSCADVIFGAGTTAPTVAPAPIDPAPVHPGPTEPTNPPPGHGDHPPESHSHAPGPTPTWHEPPAPSPNEPTDEPVPAAPDAEPWVAYHVYGPGAMVSFNGRVFRCVQGHTSLPSWEPSAVPALWLAVVTSGGTATWQTQVSYSVGDLVVHNGVTYRAIQTHVSLAGWEPPHTPALWQPE